VIRALDGLALALGAAVVGDLALGWWRPEEVFLALLAAVALRSLLRPYALPAPSSGRAVAIGVVSYAAVFSFVTVTRHWALRTHALDLGYYVQLLWSLGRGLGARVSLPEMHAWGDHFSPTLYLLLPLATAFPGALFLLVAQSVAFALGALPLFAVARRRLGSEGPAAAFALLYLLSPTLHGINLRDFHAAALAIPLLLTAVYCVEAGRMGWFLVALALTLGCREDAALAGIGLGLWIALSRRRWLWGLGVAAGSLAFLLLATGVLMPHFRGAPYPHLGRYAHLGGSLGEIVLTMLLRPGEVLGLMASAEKLRYLLALLAPLGGLPLLRPLELLPAVPTLVHNLVSQDPVLFSFRSQYNAFVLPFLLVGAVSGYARLSSRLEVGGRRLRSVALGLAFLLSLALTSRTLNDLAVNRWWLGERQRAAHALLARVPPEPPVSTQERLVPHLATRPKVFVFPVGLEQSEYVLLDEAAYPWRDLPGVRLERRRGGAILTVTGSDRAAVYRYELVGEAQGYVLLRRAG
jgi:uncharacterized membrane protein